jgi:hypothetical protein
MESADRHEGDEASSPIPSGRARVGEDQAIKDPNESAMAPESRPTAQAIANPERPHLRSRTWKT